MCPPTLARYLPTWCYPHNKSACFSPATDLRDVQLINPLAGNTGGYVLQ